MEIEHQNWLEANIENWETAKNGFIRNLELDVLKMYEHIYRLYLDKNFVLTVWCGACKMDMITRLYTWYEQQPKPVIELKPIQEQFDIVKDIIEKEVKRRGRKPKANG